MPETTEGKTLKRVFKIGSKTLPDPNPGMNPEQVKQFYAPTHTELLNAGVGSPKDDLRAGTRTYEFIAQYGRKG